MCNVFVCVELTLGKRGTEIWLSSGSSYRSVLLNETPHNKKRTRHHMLKDKECIFLCIYVDFGDVDTIKNFKHRIQLI